MGSWIVDIANYVRANVPAFASSAFAFQLPEGATTPSVIIAPPIEGLEYNRELPDWYRGYFQAVVSSPDIAETRDQANAILRALTMYETTVGGIHVVKCVSDTLPIVFPKSEADLFEASVTFNITFVDARTRTGS